MASNSSIPPVQANTALRQWENSDFPTLCEACLGENPYVRMLVDRYGASCKMCQRPFTIFKWRPGRGEGYRKTEVCQTCAKVKNLCQTCLLDLQLGLPSQLRDAVLSSVDGELALPESDVNREYQAQQALMLINEGLADSLGEQENEKLLQIARTVATDRAQPRVKIFQQKKKPSDLLDSAGHKRKASEACQGEEEGNSDPLAALLPPELPVERLPANIKNFVMKHFGQQSSSQSSSAELPTVGSNTSREDEIISEEQKVGEEKEGDSKKEKKKVNKFKPRPPPGPPPASALVK
eukprot:gene1077-1167_t